MKVLVISDVQGRGGAGIAAKRLACALIEHGHDVLCATPYPDPESDVPTANCRDLPVAGRAARRVALALQPGRKQAVESQAIVRRLRQIIRRFQADVINVHNLHGASLPATLPTELSQSVPVVWTMHDMWAFTGTCAYALGCRKFESACDASCPMADAYPSSPSAWIPSQFAQRKRALANAGRIAFVSPSRWLADEAKRGMLAGFDVRAIPNCIDLDRLRPIDRDAARQSLDLPLGRPVFVVTATPGDPRKGASILYDAMDKLDRPNTILLQLGGVAPADRVGGWDHRVLTGIHDSRLLRLSFSAADAHILPTLADNLPNTLLEAAACGVPSIGSDIGGVGDVVRKGETGWLVPAGDAGALADRIGEVIDQSPEQSVALRRACRTYAEANFAPALQARRYTELFIETINQRDSRPVSNDRATVLRREAA